MQKIINLLNQKWALLFAFVPGINVLYLFFRFFTVHDKSYNFFLLVIGLAVLPGSVLYHVLPDSWNWVITHLMISAITVFVMHKSRGAYRQKFSFPFSPEAIAPIIVAVMFISTSGQWVPSIPQQNVAGRNINIALDAIIQDDRDAWQALIHPVYGTALLDLERFQQDLNADGIVLGESFSVEGRTAIVDYHVEDGDAVEVEKLIETRDEIYRVTAVYQTSENGSGFIIFKIKEAFS